jgi:hypothetical protein
LHLGFLVTQPPLQQDGQTLSGVRHRIHAKDR